MIALNLLGRHKPPEHTKACFRCNWSRLCEVKRFYDPHNLFKNSFWPLNADGEMVEPRMREPAPGEHLVPMVDKSAYIYFI